VPDVMVPPAGWRQFIEDSHRFLVDRMQDPSSPTGRETKGAAGAVGTSVLFRRERDALRGHR